MDKPRYDLFLFAGEPSADLHGEALLKALYAQKKDLKIYGVGGPKMRAQGMTCIMNMEEFQVMGFVDVFLALPKLISQFYKIADFILQSSPPACVFIDYPGFNLRMEKHLRKKNFKGKLIHYICPTVWVWGKGRIATMEQSLDRLLTILPFEKKCFSASSLSVDYVGHPLTSRIRDYAYSDLSLPPSQKIIGVFPGSRRKEILRNFPLYAALMKKLLSQNSDLLFAISISQKDFSDFMEYMLAKEDLKIGKNIIFVDTKYTYDLMKCCDMAIAKSGTVTLELALHHVPTVVTYGVSRLDLFIAQKILKISLPYYSLASLLCEEQVFPELIGPSFTQENLEQEVLGFLEDEKKREHCKKLCAKLHILLQDKRASEEAAKLILQDLALSEKKN